MNLIFLKPKFKFFKYWNIFKIIFDIIHLVVNKFNKNLLKLIKTLYFNFIYYISRVLAIFCYIITLFDTANLYRLYDIF